MAKFTHELDDLVANEIITPDVAEKIRGYYHRHGDRVDPSRGTSSLVIAFGIIGALLVGMGVVLIIAHNWDVLSKGTKLVIGLGPMLACHVAAGFLVIKQSTSKAWTESIGVLLVFAVSTAIAIVSQVYNISGDFPKFLMTWTILTLPVIYVLRSWMASLLYWIGILWFALEPVFTYGNTWHDPWYFWPLALVALPFYILLIRRSPNANSISFHNWLIAGSATIVLGLKDFDGGSDLIIPAYITLFSIFILIGQLPYFATRKLISNAWLVGGSAGTIILLLFLTFEWPGLSEKNMDWWLSTPLFVWIFLFVAAGALLYIIGNRVGYSNVLSKSYTFIIFLFLFVIGLSNPLISRALANVLLLALGVYTIREGALANQLWKMNYGLLILSILIACRFFDTDMSFVIRGLLFVAIGAGFFIMNVYMVRKRKVVS
jgi:uncharacterized membrane protein